MALSTPADREFRTLRAGYIRDSVVLANFREGLRSRINPETGVLFTEEEIARATRPGSRWYNEANGIDDYGQGEQRNALFLADQVILDRASGRWLLNLHGRMWDVSHLDASGGSGAVQVNGTPGTIVNGSTTIPDAFAYQARDPAGNLYQVFTPSVVGSLGFVKVTLAAMGSGAGTNPPAGTVLTWATRDPSMTPTATVLEDFRGGTNRETDEELVSRIAAIIRWKPGSGNDSQTRMWAREASNAIEDGFVYPCALNAGSTLVTITGKRTTRGPLGRFPSPATLTTAIAYLTPPTSPVSPPKFGLVTGPVSVPSDLVLRMSLPRGSWPSYHATRPYVSALSGASTFFVTTLADTKLPGHPSVINGPPITTDLPAVMLWDAATSAWRKPVITAIVQTAVNEFRITHDGTITATVGQWVSPFVAVHEIIAQAVAAYYDELGPGELINAAIDSRGGRCRRFPTTTEERPSQAGSVVSTRVIEALGGTIANVVVAHQSPTDPGYPTNLQLGGRMLTLGNLAVYGN